MNSSKGRGSHRFTFPSQETNTRLTLFLLRNRCEIRVSFFVNFPGLQENMKTQSRLGNLREAEFLVTEMTK